MTDRPWSKFFWSDWDSDEGLKQCSFAAQGLWMRMLCICAKGDPYGYLAINGQPLDASSVARSVGADMAEVESLMDELDRWGVFSRDRKGRIYSRRMVKDLNKSKTGEKYAKKRWSQGADKKEEKRRPNGPPNGEPNAYKPEDRSQKNTTGFSPEFEEVWKIYPVRQGGNSKKAAYKAWCARLNAGFTAEQMADGVRRYSVHLKATGKTGSEFVKQASTFFGPSEHFMEIYGQETRQTEPDWRQAAQSFAKFSIWPAWAPGPSPDQPGCKCPDEILREFGLRRAA